METLYPNFLKAHLNVAWIRPASAFWDSIASTLICKHEIISPSLDLGCGNGIFSFITAEGNFSIDYDWYVNVDTEGFWDNKDIYNTCKIGDTADSVITKRPTYVFDIGLDHKASLLKQAKALNFYQNLIEHDANKPLPFKDGEFKTVFSNILYWLDNLRNPLKEVYRILGENGTAILCMPNNRFFKYCSTYHWKEKNSELLRLLNRGRTECMHWTISYNEFSALARKIGFKIVYHTYYLSPLTLKIWDIDLRPLSPLLIKMAGKLNPEDRRAIKQEWIETAAKFLLPLYDIENKMRQKGGYNLFVLKKQ